MKEKVIEKWVEPLMHFCAVGLSLCTAIGFLVFDQYNFQGTRCWINAYPVGCEESEDIVCTRGVHSNMFRWLFYGIFLLFAYIFIPVCMGVVFWKVRSNEKLIQTKYAGMASTIPQVRNSSASNNVVVGRSSESRRERKERRRGRRARMSKRTKAIAKQGLAYVVAFYLTYSWHFVSHTVESITGKPSFALVFLSQLFFPLQGFMNFIVYARPRVERVKRDSPSSQT